jgi:hypothetical protein
MATKPIDKEGHEWLGFILFHPKELHHLEDAKQSVRDKQERLGELVFELHDSPSSGEVFATFYDLHIWVPVRPVRVLSCPYPEWWWNKHVGGTISILNREQPTEYYVSPKYHLNEKGEWAHGGTIPKIYCELVET